MTQTVLVRWVLNEARRLPSGRLVGIQVTVPHTQRAEVIDPKTVKKFGPGWIRRQTKEERVAEEAMLAQLQADIDALE